MQESKKQKCRGLRTAGRLLTAAGGGMLSAIGGLWIMAFSLYSGVIPAKYLFLCPYLAVGLGGILCGLLSLRFPKRLYGALGSAGLMVVFFALSGMLLPGVVFHLPQGGIVAAVALGSSVLSSVLLSFFC